MKSFKEWKDKNISEITLGDVAKDRAGLSNMIWQGKQMVADALDKLAQRNPQDFMTIINRLIADLRSEKENTGNLRTMANKFGRATYAAHRDAATAESVKFENNFARFMGGSTIDVDRDIRKELKSKVDNVIRKFEGEVPNKEELFKKIVAAVGSIVADINSGSYAVSSFENDLEKQSAQGKMIAGDNDPVAREA